VFAAYFLGMLMLLFIGIYTGSPARLIYGADYHGNTCGVERGNGMTNGGFDYEKHDLIVYPRINLDLQESYSLDISWSNINLYGICVDRCPSPFDDGALDFVCNYETEYEVSTDMSNAGAIYDNRRARADWIRNDFDTALYVGLYTVGSKYSNGCWAIDVPFEDIFYRCLQEYSQTTNRTEICSYPADSSAYYELKAKYRGNDVQFPQGGIRANPSFGEFFVPNDNCQTKHTIVSTEYISPASENPLYDQFNHWIAIMQRFIGDLHTIGWFILLFGGILCLVVGFLITSCLQHCIKCAVWTICFAVCILSCALTLFFAVKADYFVELGLDDIDYVDTLTESVESLDPLEGNAETVNKRTYEVLFFVMLIVTVTLFLLLCCLKKYIQITIAVIREATRAIEEMPLIVLFPLITFILQVLNMAYFIGSSAFILSASELEDLELPSVVDDTYDAAVSFVNTVAEDDSSSISATNLTLITNATLATHNSTGIKHYVEEEWVVYMFWYNVLGVLWIDQIIRAIGICTISGAVCYRYWTRADRDGRRDEVGNHFIVNSFVRTFKYSFGSIVLGALIVAIIEFIRTILMYIDRQTRELQKESGAAVRVAICVVHCCLRCLKSIALYITRNAYIIIAMEGEGFCYAASKSISYISNNFVQISTLESISHFVLRLMKIAMTLLCGIAMFDYIDQSEYKYGTNGTDPLHFPLFPPLLTMVLAYAVSSSFVNVFELIIDTTLLCYCADKEINTAAGDDNGGGYYMSEELKALVTDKRYVDNTKHNPYKDAGKQNGVHPEKIEMEFK
jgi:choline transporter-like protein 2/4/5